MGVRAAESRRRGTRSRQLGRRLLVRVGWLAWWRMLVRKLALAPLRTLAWKVLVNRRLAVSLMRRRAPKRAVPVKALSLECAPGM